ncbi:MAG: threonylcarbamoyl-AMP synthase [Candidatus Caenarcaniphilales bacterium]|jgi:L-threonylcarbamoyladenylate synthase|nr:threonylcarbamoyl-AMP synthase [Candidatus Caenarcaniphilales bacterium]
MVQILRSNQIDKAAELILAGEIVAIPTETVYGLAGLACNDNSIKKIYDIKGRPSFNPLISHYADLDSIIKDVVVNQIAFKLLELYSPGPITLVLPKTSKSRINALATADLSSAAIRIPKHPMTRELLTQVNLPVVAPSANASNKLSPVTADHVRKSLGEKINWILDAGQTEIGLESTVIEVFDETISILRPGAITLEMLAKEFKIIDKQSNIIKSPGMLEKHYSPKCPLRLGYENPKKNEGLIAFGNYQDNGLFAKVINISINANVEEAAHNLFDALHKLEDSGVDSIAIMPIPLTGIGLALNDRLKRAAS